MTTTLEIVVPPETEQWLRDRVATGGYASIGELIETLVAEHQVSELDLAEDDLLWAKPDIDEALAAVARGEVMPIEAVEQMLKDRFR
jgi:Arc/MetJ-type ribon-helix-helix transcriptional regulator